MATFVTIETSSINPSSIVLRLADKPAEEMARVAVSNAGKEYRYSITFTHA